MSDFLILSDYPAIADSKRSLNDNVGRRLWALLYSQGFPSGDSAVEFLYNSPGDIRTGNDRWRAIEAKHKPRVILALGQEVCKVLGIEGKIFDIRGSVVKLDRRSRETWVIPTFNPRDLKKPLRMFAEEKLERAYFTAGDIRRAVTTYRSGWHTPPERFNIDPTIKDVEKFVEDSIRDNRLLGMDIEADGLNLEHANPVVLGFAWNESDAIIVPLLTEGGREYWNPSERLIINRLMNRLFKECKFIFQNGVGYDVPLLRQRGWNFPLSSFEEDTMIQHHCLTGDTRIDTLDYGMTPIESLVGKKDFYTVSFDEVNKKLVPGRVKNCWEVGEREDIYRITFWNKDRGKENKLWIDCTGDHKLLKLNGEYVEAKNLVPGDSLQRGQTSKTTIENKIIHRWVYEQFNGGIDKSLDVHHIDGNHFNNNPTNLKLVTKSEHNSYHRDSQYAATQTMMRNSRNKIAKEFSSKEAYRLYYIVGLSGRETAKQLGTSFDRIRSLFRFKNWKMRTRGEALQLRHEKKRNCRVLSVVKIAGKQKVYDIEVEKFHNFSANGLIVHNCLSPELPHKLGFISSQYGKQPFWKSVFRDYLGNKIYEAPDDPGTHEVPSQQEMRRYCARDCVALHQIRNGMNSDMKEKSEENPIYKDLHTVYEHEMKVARVVIKMFEQGIALDKRKVSAWQKKINEEVSQKEGRLYTLAELPPSFNFGSTHQMRLLLYGERPEALDGVLESIAKYDLAAGNYQYECRKCGRKVTKKYYENEKIPKTRLARCPACKKDMEVTRTTKDPTPVKGLSKDTKAYAALAEKAALAKVRPLYKLRGYVPFQTKAENPGSAIDKPAITRYIVWIDKRLDALTGMRRKLAKHEEEELGLKKTKEFLVAFTEYNKVKKLQESFYEFQTWSDGKVRPHFLVTGTATGRFSCKDPNLQQVPSGTWGKYVRSCFRADPDHTLIGVDFSNLEVQIGGRFMGDDTLIAQLEAGLNLHDENTKTFFGVTTDDPSWDLLRKAAKIIQFGRLFYGGGDPGIFSQVITAVPDSGLTLKKFREAVSNYMDEHSQFAEWVEKVQALAQSERISPNAFGRVRVLLGDSSSINRVALNNPIQGSAADAVSQDMVLLDELFTSYGMKTRIVLQIHDELLFHVPLDEVSTAGVLIKKVMNRKRTVNGYTFRIPIDAEIGTHWGAMDSYDLITQKITKGSKH